MTLISPRISWMITGNPESSGDDRQADGNDDPRVLGEADEVVAVEREARVVERRDRVEGAVPQRRGGVLVVGDPEAAVRTAAVAASNMSMIFATRNSTARTSPRFRVWVSDWATSWPRRPMLLRTSKRQERCQGHDAEPADLDEAQDDGLAERRPERGRVHGDQPGDAHGRDGGEQGRHQNVGIRCRCATAGSISSPAPRMMTARKASGTERTGWSSARLTALSGRRALGAPFQGMPSRSRALPWAAAWTAVARPQLVPFTCRSGQPTWMPGRRSGSGSFSRMISRTTGAVSPRPRSR